jgi:hypothetical protein
MEGTAMIQDVVTVTQMPDLNQMIFQAHSIDLWITDSITHWVIVQDRSDLDQWHCELSPFYCRHRLELHPTLLPADQYDRPDRDGYRRQQLLKLMASQLIDHDRYMVLDSKNFFWRTQSLTNWPTLDGRPVITDVNATGPRQLWLNDVSRYLGIEPINHTYEVLTPFVMTTEIARRCCSYDMDYLFNDLSIPTQYWEAEQTFYSLIAYNFFDKLRPGDRIGQPDLTRADTYYLTLADMSRYQLDRWLSVPSNLCSAIHRDVIASLAFDHRNLLIDWFESIGFDRDLAALNLTPVAKIKEAV